MALKITLGDHGHRSYQTGKELGRVRVGACLEVMCAEWHQFPSYSLVRTQSHGHTQLQGRLGNTVQLCAQE